MSLLLHRVRRQNVVLQAVFKHVLVLRGRLLASADAEHPVALRRGEVNLGLKGQLLRHV